MGSQLAEMHQTKIISHWIQESDELPHAFSSLWKRHSRQLLVHSLLHQQNEIEKSDVLLAVSHHYFNFKFNTMQIVVFRWYFVVNALQEQICCSWKISRTRLTEFKTETTAADLVMQTVSNWHHALENHSQGIDISLQRNSSICLFFIYV